MTDKEAISNLNQIYGFVSSEIQQSLDLAIKALEERPQGERCSMTDKETALCERYSRRDENGKVHCYKCPLVIDKNACVCKKVLEELDKSYEYDKNQLPIV